MTANQARRRFEPRIRALLRRVRTEMEYRGYSDTCAPFTMHDEEYAWTVCGRRPDGLLLNATLYLCEEKVRDGEGDGLTFMLSLVGEGGQIIGTLAPSNYTPECFVHSYDELEARWAAFENADLDWND